MEAQAVALVRACCAGPLGSLLAFCMNAPLARLRSVFPVSRNNCDSVAVVFSPPKRLGRCVSPAVHRTPQLPECIHAAQSRSWLEPISSAARLKLRFDLVHVAMHQVCLLLC